jgi:hypothetical protein
VLLAPLVPSASSTISDNSIVSATNNANAG